MDIITTITFLYNEQVNVYNRIPNYLIMGDMAYLRLKQVSKEMMIYTSENIEEPTEFHGMKIVIIEKLRDAFEFGFKPGKQGR